MRREPITNFLVFCLLIAIGVTTRWISDAYQPMLSNFTATGAVALFAGYYFRNKLAAFLTPLAVIAISNFALRPFNNLGQFAIVYVGLIIAVLIGAAVRRKYNTGTVIGGSLASSVSFYLLTNFADWPFNDLYPHNFAGLIESYVAGIPFFRNAVVADLLFTGAIFGAYWAVSRVGTTVARREVAEAGA